MMLDEARLFLVRHAQASLGSDDYDRLSGLGRAQAGKVAQRLEPVLHAGAQLWCGTLRRQRQTLEPLQGPDGRVQQTSDLDEFSTHGLVRAALRNADRLERPVPPTWQLADPVTHLDELLAWFPCVLAAWQADRLPDRQVGSWSDFRERVLRPGRSWAAALEQGRSVVVVSSAGVIATLVAELAGFDLPWQRSLAVKLYNASVSELRRVEGAWQLVTCNCVRHLDGDGLRTLA